MKPTVDLVIFARFYFSRISRGGQIHEFKNLAKINIIIALLKKNDNLNTRKLADLRYIIGKWAINT